MNVFPQGGDADAFDFGILENLQYLRFLAKQKRFSFCFTVIFRCQGKKNKRGAFRGNSKTEQDIVLLEQHAIWMISVTFLYTIFKLFSGIGTDPP